MSILVTQSTLPPLSEYIDEIASLWNSRWLTNNGSLHQKLESQLCEFLGVEHLSLFTNGHLALEAVLEALELTGEVITTPFTFVSTTHAIVRRGLVPIFCDIKDSDYTLDVSQLERLITPRTTAILPVHVYGNICDADAIQDIADRYGLKVIYDAAHAFAEKVSGVGVGALGDASMFSFHATKVFNTIEGGAVVCKDPRIKRKLDVLKNFGIDGPEDVIAIGANAKMNEFQAAMGICNLRHIDEAITKRKAVAERYDQNLSGIHGIKLNPVPSEVMSNYAYYPVVFGGFHKTRDEVFAQLKGQDIHARKYFYPTTNSLSCYAGMFDPSETPVAQHIAQRVLTLPLYPDLSLDDVDRICAIITS